MGGRRDRHKKKRSPRICPVGVLWFKIAFCLKGLPWRNTRHGSLLSDGLPDPFILYIMKQFKSFFLLFLSLWIVASADAKKKTEVIAHRGYWTCEGSAQNSIASLKGAKAVGAFGSEFDVHLTKDDVPVVFHDDTLQGKPIHTSAYSALQDLKLPNGEVLPVLRNYLSEAGRQAGLRLVLEVKAHGSPGRDREIARRAVEEVNRQGLDKRTDYITFSREAGRELIRLAPRNDVYYLNGDLSPEELKNLGYAGLDYQYKVMQKHPEWFDEAHRLGLKVNVWTVDDPLVMEEMVKNGADFITTNYPEEAQEIVRSLFP